MADFRTHRCMVLAPVAELPDGEGGFSKGCAIWADPTYVGFQFRIRFLSAPGEAQPTDNLTPNPNLMSWFVEASNATLQLIAADPDYPLLTPIEGIPVDVII